jgi:hypothetical protein
MNDARRLLLQEIIEQLEQTNERLRRIWNEEEKAFENRTPASMETVLGATSKEAIDDFERAADSIEEGCEILRGILA